MEEADADLLFVGHSHKPHHKILKGCYGSFKHIVNLGSVGKPKDGDPRGCYVLITLNNGTSTSESDSLEVEFRRVEYDVEVSARSIENSFLPHEFAQAIRDAK